MKTMKTYFVKFFCFVLLLTCFIDVPPAVPADDAGASKKIAAALQPFVDKHELAGAVALVADRDKVLSLQAVGFADVRERRPMLIEMLFWIASQTKPITATALMMLVDEGKVKLDDPVEKYLPELKDLVVGNPGKKPAHPITVRQILNHTSGMPFRSAEEQPTLDKLSLREAILSYAKTPLVSEPGTKYLYSNVGINTAGRIIEVVSGMSYEDFMDKRLFGPLGMKDTTFWPNEEQLKRLARTYRPTKDKKGLEAVQIAYLKYPLNDRKRQPMPAGGLFATASDVGIFCQMILNGGVYKGKRYLSEASVKEMTRRQTANDMKASYGLGWAAMGETFGHGGANATNMSIDTKRGLVLVWMVQHNGFPGNGAQAQAAFRKTAEEMFGKGKR